uniref:Uncharacterized protein n=1 Tax=Peronospora matthiolae TaxID=2874970 RepID=A0AAV1UIJ5_9STRA
MGGVSSQDKTNSQQRREVSRTELLLDVSSGRHLVKPLALTHAVSSCIHASKAVAAVTYCRKSTTSP